MQVENQLDDINYILTDSIIAIVIFVYITTPIKWLFSATIIWNNYQYNTIALVKHAEVDSYDILLKQANIYQYLS